MEITQYLKPESNQISRHWSYYYKRSRLLFRLKHNETGENAVSMGSRFEPIPQRANELLDPKNAPIILDKDFDITQWSIVAATKVLV